MRVKEKTPFPLRFSNFFSLIISAQCTKNTISGTEKKNSRCNNNHDDDDDDDLRRRRRQLQHNSSKCEGAERTPAKTEAGKMTTLPSVASQQQQMRRGGAHTREDGSRKDDDVAQRSLEFLQSIPVVHSSIYIVIHLSLVTHLRRGKSLFKARFTRREILNATVTPTGKLKPEKK
jgi:hypothetical protein